MPRRLATPPAPRNERADDTRSRVVQAATRVFARYGFRQASMELLAQEVQLSRQSLYNHFPNKEAVFAAAVQALQDWSLSAARRAATRWPSWWARWSHEWSLLPR